MSKIHMQLMTSFSKKGQENTGISEELKNALPENVRDKVIELNNVCFEQSNNNDKPMREQIKRLVDRQFNENSYDMGTQKI